MRGECNRNYRDCKLCPDVKHCPYELSKGINNGIKQERGREVEWDNSHEEKERCGRT